MKDRKFMKPIPPELSEEYDDYVNDGVALAEGKLSPDRAAAVRARMEMDPMYRKVIEPIIDAWQAPSLSPDEARRHLAEFWKRAGVEPASESDELSAYRERVKARGSRNWKLIAGIAAVFAFLMLLPASFWVYLEVRYFETFETPANVEGMVRLPDQSSVRLAPASSIRYNKEMANRQRRWVVLEGEGTFTVVPTPMPAVFVVETPVAYITVIATRFTVQATDASTIVAVDEGRVSVQPRGGDGRSKGRPTILNAGGRVRVTSAGVFEETKP
jgi:ferric-dicitrate binding protein FerR (iron transport regulator)